MHSKADHDGLPANAALLPKSKLRQYEGEARGVMKEALTNRLAS
jgi:hypothetical protein